MAQLGDFFARIFSPGGAHGLSGDADLVLPQEPELSFFNECLRLHRTNEDFIGDPGRLWSTATFLSRKGGLKAHLSAEKGDGLLGLSDVLIVVNKDDWRRTWKELREPWTERALGVLRERWREFVKEEDVHLLFPQRELRFHVVEDGDERLMRGNQFGLLQGEFVTGLLPNFYPGPVPGSRKSIAVHLHIPGAWEGYREVGLLYNDQVLFTLGNHWLDNFSHPALAVPALYRLQQHADGSFLHIISPDAPEKYRIACQEEGNGPAILAIEDANGKPLCWFVLAVVESARTQIIDAPATAQLRPLATPAPEPPRSMNNSRTVVPVEVDDRILTLREKGALLQKVHFARFMEGYDVYVGRSGEVGTNIPDAAAILQVRGNRVWLLACRPDVTVDGHKVAPGAPVPLSGHVRLHLGAGEVRYTDLSQITTDGWPYLGEIRRGGGTQHLVFGGRYRIGRERRCKIRLPDEPHNDNIVWRPEMENGRTISSRQGEIPKSRFYTDSIMVATEHAELDLTREPVLHSIARHCYTYLRRGPDIFPLFPAQNSAGPTNVDVSTGDEILVGNCLFEVSFPPSDRATTVPLAPPTVAPVSAAELAAAMDEEPEEDRTVKALPELGKGPAALDLAPAAGLGEKGPPPPRVLVEEMETGDSLTGPPLRAPVEPPVRPGGPPPAPVLPPLPPPAPPVKPAPLVGRPMMVASAPMLLPEEAPPRTSDPTEVPGMAPPPPIPLDKAKDSVLGIYEDPLDAPVSRWSKKPTAPVGGPEVVVVEEADWQLELSRPARFSLVGWMLQGKVLVANFIGADVVIPENRCQGGQTFPATRYFEFEVRGRRGKVKKLSDTEARLEVQNRTLEEVLAPENALMEVIRRDPSGEEDFAVALSLRDDPNLPDPRARLLEVDAQDRMVRALFTVGLPLRTSRRIRLGPIELDAMYDGRIIRLSGYAESYRRSDGGFIPFFVKLGDRPFCTVPEDGTTLELQSGDLVLAGTSLYRVGN